MNRSAYIYSLLIATLAVLSGCSSKPPASESKKAEAALESIQGRAQVLTGQIGTGDAALNPSGPAVYLWVGPKRYRLFSRTTMEVVHGRQYVVEGVNAQKFIDEIGDPDQGKGGYPLRSSCERVVTTTWGSMAFDAIDAYGGLLRERVARYPARPVFLVTKIEPAPPAKEGAGDAKEAEKDIREITVPGDKQSASLTAGTTVRPAPLWEPAGGKVDCKILIDEEGKIEELQTGVQLCESVDWAEFRYQPPVQGGRPVKVKSDVEITFEPRK